MERAVERIVATTAGTKNRPRRRSSRRCRSAARSSPRRSPRRSGSSPLRRPRRSTGRHRPGRWRIEPVPRPAAITRDWKHFDFALDDGVATVTFSRPDKLNALTFDVYADLRDLLGELPHRGDPRRDRRRPWVLLGRRRRGDHRRAPVDGCARAARVHAHARHRRQAMRETIPIVAAVNGVAAGAGAVLALAADLRIVASSAKFSFSSRRSGWPGRTWARRTCSRASSASAGRASCSSAARSRLRGRPRSAWRRASSPVTSWPRPRSIARELADGPALAYATTKLLLTRELDLDLGGAVEMEALAQALLMKSEDFGEFYAAWSEGRSPAWSGR